MKRFAVLGAAVALAILVFTATSAADPTVEPCGEPSHGAGVMYQCEQAPEGVLTVVHAAGRPIGVLDAHFNLVYQGHVPEDHFECIVPNEGPGRDGAILYVWLGGRSFLIIDSDDDWIWE